MSPNYNLGYGSKRMSTAPRGNHGKYLLAILLVLIIASAFAAIAISRHRRSDSKARIQTQHDEKSQTPASQPNPAIPRTPPPATNPTAAAPVAATVQPSRPPRPAIAAMLEKARQALSASDWGLARSTAEQALAEIGDEKLPEWNTAAKMLGQANINIINSDYPLPEKKERYVIKSGDFLQKLANRFNTTVETIQKGNNMSPTDKNIMAGHTIRIYKGQWSIRVSKKLFRLYLMDGDKLFKVYDIGTGKQDRTPTGKFMVVSKIKEPVWTFKGEQIPFGDERNVLGTHWLELRGMDEDNKELQGYGIHGTWERDSIGKSRSNGCVRMLNEEVEELYNLIPYRTMVVIED